MLREKGKSREKNGGATGRGIIRGVGEEREREREGVGRNGLKGTSGQVIVVKV